MSHHTPAPWNIEGLASQPLFITSGDPLLGDNYRIIAVQYDREYPELLADFQLISAVTELLAACKAAQSVLWMAKEYADAGGSHGPEMRDYQEAETLIISAIAKATGEPR